MASQKKTTKQKNNVPARGISKGRDAKKRNAPSRPARPKFRIPRKKIAAFCEHWGVTEFSLFGSVLRDDFRPRSDIDVLLVIKPDAPIGLGELVEMQLELEKLFKRDVDIVEKDGLRNPYRRKAILSTAKVIYAAQ